MASESRKHAARRPRPPLPRPASGSFSNRALQVLSEVGREVALDEFLDLEVRDRARRRSADQELHRQVVDLLGVLVVIRPLGEDPALREHVPHRTGHGLEPVAIACSLERNDVVEDQVTVIVVVIVESQRTNCIALQRICGLVHSGLQKLRGLSWNDSIICEHGDHRSRGGLRALRANVRNPGSIVTPCSGRRAGLQTAAGPASGPPARGRNGRGRRAVVSLRRLSTWRAADRRGADLLDRLAAGATVAKKRPGGILAADLG